MYAQGKINCEGEGMKYKKFRAKIEYSGKIRINDETQTNDSIKKELEKRIFNELNLPDDSILIVEVED